MKTLSLSLLLTIVLAGIFSASLTSCLLLREIQDNSKEFIFQRKEFARVEASFENQKEMRNAYQKHESGLKKIETFFVKKSAPVEFIEFLEQRAGDCSLSIEISSLSFKEPKGKWEVLNLQMSLEGEQQNFLRFLEQIENSRYLIEIEKLNLKQAGRARQGIIEAFLTVEVPAK